MDCTTKGLLAEGPEGPSASTVGLFSSKKKLLIVLGATYTMYTALSYFQDRKNTKDLSLMMVYGTH